jgi:hypothetical protein
MLRLRPESLPVAGGAHEGIVVEEPLDPRDIGEVGAVEGILPGEVVGVRQRAGVAEADLLVPRFGPPGALAAEGEARLLAEGKRGQREVRVAFVQPLGGTQVERQRTPDPRPVLRKVDARGARLRHALVEVLRQKAARAGREVYVGAEAGIRPELLRMLPANLERVLDREIGVERFAAAEARVGEIEGAVVGVAADVVEAGSKLSRSARAHLRAHQRIEIVAHGPVPAQVVEVEAEGRAVLAVADGERPAAPPLGGREEPERQPEGRRDTEEAQLHRAGVDVLVVHDLHASGFERIVRMVQAAGRVGGILGIDDVGVTLLDDAPEEIAVLDLRPGADDAPALRLEVVDELASGKALLAFREPRHLHLPGVGFHGERPHLLPPETELESSGAQLGLAVARRDLAEEKRSVVRRLAVGAVAVSEDDAERIAGGVGDRLFEPTLGRRRRHDARWSRADGIAA